jgi:hypothetical protein
VTRILRSVDLDEWTPEQLQIMKLSGNANAKNFFLQHGVTATQMEVRVCFYYRLLTLIHIS